MTDEVELELTDAERAVLANEHVSETLRKMFAGESVETVEVDWRS